MKYYDFNEPITIEPPTTASGELLPGWCLVDSSSKELTFSRNVTFTIGGEDPAHQQISFRITITNIGTEVASNVRVTLSTMATNEESESVSVSAGGCNESPECVAVNKRAGYLCTDTQPTESCFPEYQR